MAKSKVLEAANGIVAILEPLESDDRARVIQAAWTLLGEGGSPVAGTTEGGDVYQGTPGAAGTSDAKAYFDSKEPRTKGEELATAARFREENEGVESSTRDEIKAVFKAARRNFDGNNFRRDLENARTKGLFNRGTGKDTVVLSHYGQNYIDALPDRETVKQLRKPKGRGKKKKTSKKKNRG